MQKETIEKLVAACRSLSDFQAYYKVHAFDDTPGNEFYSQWLMKIVTESREALAHVERELAEPEAAGPCPSCGRSYKGQGTAYYGPACPLGDKCCAVPPVDRHYRAAAKFSGVDPDALLTEAGKVFEDHKLPEPPVDREADDELPGDVEMVYRTLALANHEIAELRQAAGVDVAAIREVMQDMRDLATQHDSFACVAVEQWADRLESAIAGKGQP